MQNSEDLGSVKQNDLVSFFSWTMSPRRGHSSAERSLWAAYRENALPMASLFPPSSPGKRTCLIEKSLFILGSQVNKKGRRGGREERRDVPHPEPPSHLAPHPIPLGHPSALALSALSHASNLDWRSVSHMVIYMFQCYFLKSSHPCFLPQSPKVCFYICVSFAVSYIESLPSF